MREFFYAAMLTCSGAICGLLLFTAPGVHPASPVAASAAAAVQALTERASSVPLLGGR